MEVRYHNSPKETASLNTADLRQNFLMESVMVKDEIKLLYTHYDRVIIGGVMPVSKTLTLGAYNDVLKANYFLERREIGIINVGGNGEVIVNGKSFAVDRLIACMLARVMRKYNLKAPQKNHLLSFMFCLPRHTKNIKFS